MKFGLLPLTSLQLRYFAEGLLYCLHMILKLSQDWERSGECLEIVRSVAGHIDPDHRQAMIEIAEMVEKEFVLKLGCTAKAWLEALKVGKVLKVLRVVHEDHSPRTSVPTARP